MNKTGELLLAHAQRYPRMQPQDAVKLLYQGAFGAGHLLAENTGHYERLQREFESAPADPALPLFEAIGPEFCRLNLNSAELDKSDLPAVLRLFLVRPDTRPGREELFEQDLRELERLAEKGELPFSSTALAEYLDKYLAGGAGHPSHSEEYRNAHNPAYRVVRREFAERFGLICRIERMLRERGRILLAIDGMCGSGKTTLANLLGGLYESDIIHMDVFFLPPALRSAERLAQPGGNVHYERFREEVCAKWPDGQPFCYRVFDCGIMDYAGEKQVLQKPLTICEGSYSQHPYFGDPYTLRVFVRCSAEQQKNRLRARETPVQYSRFINEWIPMEQKYFEAYRIEKKSDMLIDT